MGLPCARPRKVTGLPWASRNFPSIGTCAPRSWSNPTRCNRPGGARTCVCVLAKDVPAMHISSIVTAASAARRGQKFFQRFRARRIASFLLVIPSQAGVHSPVAKVKMDNAPLLRRALRAIGSADVRSGVLPPQSGLRRDDGDWGFFETPTHTARVETRSHTDRIALVVDLFTDALPTKRMQSAFRLLVPGPWSLVPMSKQM